MIWLRSLLIAALVAFGAATPSAQTQLFSGRANTATQFLEQQFPGTVVLLSTTKENSSYSGDCMAVRRTTGGSNPGAIGWNGKECNASTFDTFCAATTCFLDTWYDQSGNAHNCVQATTTRQFQVLKAADGKLSIRSNGQEDAGCEIADSATYKVTQPNIFQVVNGDQYGEGGGVVKPISSYSTTGSPASAGRWSIGWAYGNIGGNGQELVQLNITRNAVNFNFGSTPGVPSGAWVTSMGDTFVSHDYTPSTYEFRIGGTGFVVWGPETGSNVTYPVAAGIILGNSRAYDVGWQGGYRMFVVYGSIQASRNAISAFINSSASQNLTAVPFTFTDDAGFVFSTIRGPGTDGAATGGRGFFPAFNQGVYDAFGIEWGNEFQGYNWSFARASNLASPSTTTLVQFEVKAGDFDALGNGSERAEVNVWDIVGQADCTDASNSCIVKDNSRQYWRFYQYRILTGSNTVPGVGGWCMIGQVHTNDGGSADLFYQSITNDQITFTSQRGGADTDRNTPYSYTLGEWRAVLIKFTWSTGGSLDVFEVWDDVNSAGTLTKRVNLSTPQAIFPTDSASGAYWKNGIYRGERGGWSGFVRVQIANDQIAIGADAFLAYVSSGSRPALPTHAGMQPANDNARIARASGQ